MTNKQDSDKNSRKIDHEIATEKFEKSRSEYILMNDSNVKFCFIWLYSFKIGYRRVREVSWGI